ncbi:MAG: hypothetical protein ACRDMX_00915 [Solirubrobacteraceae bacterium]
MVRTPGHLTPRGREWHARLQAAQAAVERAERARDELAREALEHGLGVRGAALALGVDKGTIMRRYRQRRA